MKKIIIIMALLFECMIHPVNAANLNEDGSIKDTTIYYTYQPFVVNFNYNSVSFQCVDLKEVVLINVYRATSKSGKYYKIGSCNGRGEFKANKLVCSKDYWFKFVANYHDGHKESRYIKTSANLFPIPYIKRTDTKMSWHDVDGAHGYAIYRAPKGTDKYRKIGTTKKPTYKASNKYDYMVRSYRKVNGKYVYSDYRISQADKP